MAEVVLRAEPESVAGKAAETVVEPVVAVREAQVAEEVPLGARGVRAGKVDAMAAEGVEMGADLAVPAGRVAGKAAETVAEMEVGVRVAVRVALPVGLEEAVATVEAQVETVEATVEKVALLVG